MLRFAWLAMAGLLWIAPTIAQTAFTPRDESPQDFPAGLGCDETWDDPINLMIRRHNMPPLDDKDRDVVLNYLEAAYPPRAPTGRGGWTNPFAK